MRKEKKKALRLFEALPLMILLIFAGYLISDWFLSDTASYFLGLLIGVGVKEIFDA